VLNNPWGVDGGVILIVKRNIEARTEPWTLQHQYDRDEEEIYRQCLSKSSKLNDPWIWSQN